MSGCVPDFIRKAKIEGGYVLFNGKKKRVLDYFWTSTDSPHVPNTDWFWVTLRGVGSVKFHEHDFKPLKTQKTKPRQPRKVSVEPFFPEF